MADFSIGTHNFDVMLNWPDLPVEQWSLEQRAAYDGTGIFPMGKKGAPFEVITKVALADLAAAESRYRDYLQTCGKKELVKLTKDAVVGQTFKVKVLNVRRTGNKTHKTMVGFANITDGQAGAKLTCVWTLIAIDQ